MIKIYLGEIDSILTSLDSLVNKELPIKLSYSLSKLIKNLESEYKILMEKRNKLIDKYAERDDKNNFVITNESGRQMTKIKNEFIDECQGKLQELFSIEIEIDFEPIPIDLLGDISISPKDLLVLDKFIQG
jgi:uncharacterized protein (DUF342 family)